jgi:uncharacterized protein YndB with AHSA1/START domain
MTKLDLKAEPGKQEIIMTRVFKAPRERVYKAFTDPNAIAKWWGGSLYQTTIDKMEPKPGGRWRFVQKGKDGSTHGFHGVYHEVTFPERIIQTFEYEGLPEPGHVLLETIKFEEQGGQTKMIDLSVFQSVEDRDGMLQSGMEEGAKASLDALAELVEEGVKT